MLLLSRAVLLLLHLATVAAACVVNICIHWWNRSGKQCFRETTFGEILFAVDLNRIYGITKGFYIELPLVWYQNNSNGNKRSVDIFKEIMECGCQWSRLVKNSRVKESNSDNNSLTMTKRKTTRKHINKFNGHSGGWLWMRVICKHKKSICPVIALLWNWHIRNK